MELVKDKDQTIWLVWHLMSKCEITMKPDSCWEWRGRYSSGYGYFYYKGRKYLMHRLMYELWYGKIPKGLLIRHMCHNHQCCNPDHLRPGTQKQNMADMRKAGRERIGRKITPAQRRQIRYSPLPLTQLAKIFNVSPTTIWRIKNNHK